MRVEFVVKENQEDVVADAEVYFDADGPFHGLKLVGITLRRGERGLYVTLPARAFGAGNDRRYFDFVRSADQHDKKSIYRFKDWIRNEWRSQNPSTQKGTNDQQ